MSKRSDVRLRIDSSFCVAAVQTQSSVSWIMQLPNRNKYISAALLFNEKYVGRCCSLHSSWPHIFVSTKNAFFGINCGQVSNGRNAISIISFNIVHRLTNATAAVLKCQNEAGRATSGFICVCMCVIRRHNPLSGSSIIQISNLGRNTKPIVSGLQIIRQGNW